MRSKGPKSAVRSHREDTSAWLDATILTEMSFAIAQDRVLQVLTDVVPWQPDWENLSVLDLSNRRVETLMKLQDFCPNLLDVNLNDNLIVYLSGLPSSIRHLQVARNRLSSLVSFARLRNLQTLDISENAVESIDNLCCLDSLKHLRADSTQIDSINGIDSIATLESISLQHNNLKTIDLQGTTWTELRHLSLSHNQLESLTGLTHLAHLYTLQVEHNNLSQLDCRGGLRKLRLLRVSGNPRLSILNIKDLAKLRTLYADFCHLDEIQHLPHAKRLENLSLRAQQNSDFRWPRHLPSSIQRMFLSGNPLQNSLPGEDAGELTNLVYLELAACQLEQLPDHMWSLMPNLRHLNLDHNLFVELPNLRALHRLKRLSAVSCRLEKTAPIIRALQDLPLESLDTRMNACTHGLYAPIIAPSRYVEPRTPNSDNLPKGFASVAPPFPNPAVVQPAFSQKELSLGKQAEDPSAAHKSFFHKRLPTPIRGASNSEQGVSQTAMTLAADARFIRALPEAARQQRTLHRGVLAMACAQLTHIDGLPVSDAEIEEASRLLE
ncbi:L domain-like protein [Tilletiaria anomala UBC 951]|uniref:L domain-like protein n=1 Tax=Tilletiaria anomala (strain ATCC 24038 / CBS 436.72 / UBC 951) TaxID=1037660 RepID=A0A066WFQ1_TILAU|nr:L domain-like protein [Tilletiaria anomala UBC 951]KDN52631.1 L domain-like protein [Tilletiaria anomala UBC 951]